MFRLSGVYNICVYVRRWLLLLSSVVEGNFFFEWMVVAEDLQVARLLKTIEQMLLVSSA